MPMGPADLTLVKLNSAVGGVGSEWGSDQGPAGAALPVEVRSQARNLGNAGQPAAAAQVLLQAALSAKVPIAPALLDEVVANIVPVAQDPAALQTLVANLRNVSASGASAGGKSKGGFFGRLFGRK